MPYQVRSGEELCASTRSRIVRSIFCSMMNVPGSERAISKKVAGVISNLGRQRLTGAGAIAGVSSPLPALHRLPAVHSIV